MNVRELIAHLSDADPDATVNVVAVGSEGAFVEARTAGVDSVRTVLDEGGPGSVWLAGAELDDPVELPSSVEYRCRCGIVHETSLDPVDEYCPLSNLT